MTKKIGYNNVSITRIDLQHGVSSGVSWGIISEGMVPVFEEQLSRIEANYKLDEWMNMEPIEKSMIIAVRRLRIAMENQQAEAEVRNAKQSAKKGRHK